MVRHVLGRRSAFLVGVGLGALIWLLSPVVTGQREPWDGEGGYYYGALLGAGLLGGLAAPTHWGATAIGVFVGQALVLLGGVFLTPASGGLWPLGVAFLSVYSLLSLLGAGLGAAARHLRGGGDGPRGPDNA
jgi:hypothetical protein